MSRSIGDTMAKKLGVIAEPEIFILRIEGKVKPRALVLASDGIWDVYKDQEIIETIENDRRNRI